MNAILALALKDLRLLLRNRGALFFTLVWPLIVAVLFGLAFGGGGGGSGKPQVAVVDADGSAASREFVTQLQAIDELAVDPPVDETTARDLVRTGKRVAAVVIPPGYGDRAQNLFFGEPPQVVVLADPSRRAEQAMLSGMLQRLGGERLGALFTQPRQRSDWLRQARAAAADATADERVRIDALLDAVDGLGDLSPIARPATTGARAAGNATSTGALMESLRVVHEPLIRVSNRPQSPFALTFAQGILWAIVGCLMSFATALVLEDMQGTLLRLRASPMPARAVLFGKGLACAIAMGALTTLLLAVAVLVFGVRPVAPGLLLLVVPVLAFAFTGMMMLVASLGRTVQTVSGAGWAMLMPLMLFGGGMIPAFVMPAWMQQVGNFSPMRWAGRALEGVIWRGFSLAELAPALAVLLAFGAVTLAWGARRVGARGL